MSHMRGGAAQADDHGHEHGSDARHGHASAGLHGAHGHTHGAVDPSLFSNARGIWAVKWSLVGLGLTAALQLAVALSSGSVALLADTIHNVGDAATAIPLWVAFALAGLRPSRRFTYGYGRVEDVAGLFIVLVIVVSAAVAAYETVSRLLQPQEVRYLWVVALAGLVGFVGNEAVAWLRIRVGKEIGSAALVADGNHARADGLTSLAVVAGAAGTWLGFPLADPIAGALITVMIARLVWESAVSVFSRLLDGVDPEVVDEVKQAARAVDGVEDVTEVRVRWLGHRMIAEVNLGVQPSLSVAEAHQIGGMVHHELLHRLSYLSQATIHMDSLDQSGEEHHRIAEHAHGGLPQHSH